MNKIKNRQELIDARVPVVTKDGVTRASYRPETDITNGGVWLHHMDGRAFFYTDEMILLNWRFA